MKLNFIDSLTTIVNFALSQASIFKLQTSFIHYHYHPPTETKVKWIEWEINCDLTRTQSVIKMQDQLEKKIKGRLKNSAIYVEDGERKSR